MKKFPRIYHISQQTYPYITKTEIWKKSVHYSLQKDVVDVDHALLMAVRKGRIGLVKYLIKAGADPHKDNILAEASRLKKENIVEYLISQKVAVPISDFYAFGILIRYTLQNK